MKQDSNKTRDFTVAAIHARWDVVEAALDKAELEYDIEHATEREEDEEGFINFSNQRLPLRCLPLKEGTEYHFFTSSGRTWCTDNDLYTCLKRQRREDIADNIDGADLFLVPCSINEQYSISFFQPQVEGVIYLGRQEWAK